MTDQLKRRAFIAALGNAVAWPLVARGQQDSKVFRVAWVHPATPVADLTESGLPPYRAFLGELRRLGYVEGQNLILDRYSAEGRPDRYDELARYVVTRQPDVIFAHGGDMPRLLQRASATIPIIAVVGDPIATGFITSLARPDANLTGVSVDAGLEIWGKRLALLRETTQGLSRAGFISGKRFWEEAAQMTPLREAAARLSISLVGCTLEGSFQDAEYRRVFAAMPQDHLNGLVVSSETENASNRAIIVQLAEQAKLPTIYPFRVYTELGGLESYGVDLSDIYRQLARQIDQVLKGAKPSDIPFYQATKFELVINLKTAKALGLSIPPSLLARADEVIE
jgi:putative tryptophan/tyrosine transport system substrate-binding protein